MSEAEKAKLLQAAHLDYRRSHSGPPAQIEADAWIAVYRKAASLVNG